MQVAAWGLLQSAGVEVPDFRAKLRGHLDILVHLLQGQDKLDFLESLKAIFQPHELESDLKRPIERADEIAFAKLKGVLEVLIARLRFAVCLCFFTRPCSVF